jgi:pyridoxine 4-dehydrogenase
MKEYFQANPGDADRVVLSIKGGLKPGQMMPDGSEKNIRRSVNDCVRVLDGTTKIDIFECARVDPHTPIETTMVVLKRLVQDGKIGGIGLSEVSAKTIRRAHKVHPIAAVEGELSLRALDNL